MKKKNKDHPGALGPVKPYLPAVVQQVRKSGQQMRDPQSQYNGYQDRTVFKSADGVNRHDRAGLKGNTGYSDPE